VTSAAVALSAAVAAKDDEVALAWVEQEHDQPAELWFARLSPSFDLIATSQVPDSVLAASAGGGLGWPPIALAPLPSGWVVAGYVEDDIYIQAIDRDGRGLGRVVVATVSPGDLVEVPRLISRAAGGPLLIWRTGDTVYASVVADDGKSATAPIVVVEATQSDWTTSAAFVGGTFYVALSVEGATDVRLMVTPVGVDGARLATFEALPGVNPRFATLVTSADELRVVYQRGRYGSGEDLAIVWQRVATTGAATSAPMVVDESDQWASTRRAYDVGGDTVAMLLGVTGKDAVAVARVDSTGALVSPSRRIAEGNPLSLTWYDMVRRGPDAVLAWTVWGQSGVKLARLAVGRLHLCWDEARSQNPDHFHTTRP
jgi:hypothetical protein